MGRSVDSACRDVATQSDARCDAIGWHCWGCYRAEGQDYPHPSREVLGESGKSRYLAAEVGVKPGALHTAGACIVPGCYAKPSLDSSAERMTAMDDEKSFSCLSFRSPR